MVKTIASEVENTNFQWDLADVSFSNLRSRIFSNPEIMKFTLFCEEIVVQLSTLSITLCCIFVTFNSIIITFIGNLHYISSSRLWHFLSHLWRFLSHSYIFCHIRIEISWWINCGKINCGKINCGKINHDLNVWITFDILIQWLTFRYQ